MILAVDIGNSNIVMGIWNAGDWIKISRFKTLAVQKSRYQKEVSKVFGEASIDINEIDDAIISSVVPGATTQMTDILKFRLNKTPQLIGPALNTGIKIEAEEPEKVGADLIADAAGAYHLTQANSIVVDFGTATTIMAIEKPGVLSGVAICAGLKSTNKSLVGDAAQLFDVPLEPPSSVLGKNTTEAMQSGIVLGHIAMVEGLIERMKREVKSTKVIATGGLVEMLAPLTESFDYIEPTLTLDGMRFILERNGTDE